MPSRPPPPRRCPALTLKGVEPTSVWFTDRPDRNAGRVTTKQLVDAWGELDFNRIAPNAALVLQSAPGKRDTAALELHEPTYHAQRRTLRFAVRRLDGLGADLANLNAKVDQRIARRFGAATLFIDSAGQGGGGLCVLGQPQLMTGSGKMISMQPADGSLLPAREYMGLASLYWTVFGGDLSSEAGSLALPTILSPAAGTSWYVCTQGTFPVGDNMGECEVGEVDLWASAGSWFHQGDGSWMPADGRTIEPMRVVKRSSDVIGRNQARVTLPNLAAPQPGLAWMVCVTSPHPDVPMIGQVDLFAQPPEDAGGSGCPRTGARSTPASSTS